MPPAVRRIRLLHGISYFPVLHRWKDTDHLRRHIGGDEAHRVPLYGPVTFKDQRRQILKKRFALDRLSDTGCKSLRCARDGMIVIYVLSLFSMVMSLHSNQVSSH